MSAVGGFASGLMAGQKHADERRRNKAIDNILDRDAYEQDLDYESRRKKYIAEGGDESMFPEFKNPAMEDPYLVKGFNWLKGKFGYGSEGEDSTYGVVEDEPREALSGFEGSGTFQAYADGGKVLPDDYEYTAMDNIKDGLKDVGGRLAGTFARSGEANRQANAGLAEKRKAIADAPDDYEKGRQVRGYLGEYAKQTGNVLAANVDDVLGPVDDAVKRVGKGVLGFVGFGGTRENPQTSLGGEHPMPENFDPEMKLVDNAVDASAGTEKPTSAIAADAVDNAVAMTPGHPDNPNQAFDWAEVRQSGVKAEDIPNMPVKDWVAYRREMAQAAAMNGEDPLKVHQDITQMQMQGAMANMQQAAFLLQANDPESAELALRASFQYFPNGSDVKFGIYDSEQGPVLVGMGYDEETGEPVGTPMALTPEKLMAMASNFEDPTNFNTWTKDQHEAMQDLRKYEEVDKPTAESEARYRDRMGRAALSNAAANQAEAARAGVGGGRKQADLDRANAAFIEQSELLALDNPAEAEQLNDVMSRVYKNNPGVQYPEVINFVNKLYREGGIEAVDAAILEMGY